jgi:hypothetical protein
MKKLLIITLLFWGCQDVGVMKHEHEPEDVGLCVDKVEGVDTGDIYWICNPNKSEALCQLNSEYANLLPDYNYVGWCSPEEIDCESLIQIDIFFMTTYGSCEELCEDAMYSKYYAPYSPYMDTCVTIEAIP